MPSIRPARLVAIALMSAPLAVIAHEDVLTSLSTDAKLGHVLFKTTCTPQAQKDFERALAMLHSFHFPETIKAFTAIPETDPSCAIAYWGMAISQRPNPLVGPWDAATLKRGLDLVNKGEAIGAKSQRERDWLAAIKVFYADYETVDQDTRTHRYEQAMDALARKYPDDVEAQIFHALALNEIFDHKSMDPLLKAAAILEPLDKKYPEHPGITHYLIHSYDFAPIAQRGLPYADKYAKIAPAAPHAQHMPSHIYSMVGKWNESVESNIRSVAVSKAYEKQAKIDGTLAGVPHSYDFMQYAYLQMGQDGKAKDLIAKSDEIKKVIGPVSAGNTARAAVPARYMLERQDWKGAAELPVMNLPFPPADAITYFARAIGKSRSGDPAAAQGDIDRMLALREGLAKANQSYWAEQVEVQILAARAWQAQAKGDGEQAFKLMSAAADLEDSSEKHVAMENRLYPMRELFADLLIAQGQPGAALLAYEQTMKSAPERLRTYFGAAKAAEAVGDKAKANAYYKHVVALTRSSDGARAEVKEARMHVSGRA